MVSSLLLCALPTIVTAAALSVNIAPAQTDASVACTIKGPSYNTAGTNKQDIGYHLSDSPTECASLCELVAVCDGFHFYGKGDPAGWHPAEGLGDCYLESGVTSLAGPLDDGRVRFAGICHSPEPPPSPPPSPPSPDTCPGVDLEAFCRTCDKGDVKGVCVGADPDYCCGNTDPSAGPTNSCEDCNAGSRVCDAAKVCGNTPPFPPSPPSPPSPPALPKCVHEDTSTTLKYDMSALQRAGPFVVETDETPKLKYRHSIGICNTGGECDDPNVDPTRPQIAACQTLVLKPPVPAFTFANGYLMNMKIENIPPSPFGAQGVVITYTGSTDNQCRSNANTRGLRTTVVEVMCSAQPIDPDPILKFISEDPKCSYNYVLESKHGCAVLPDS